MFIFFNFAGWAVCFSGGALIGGGIFRKDPDKIMAGIGLLVAGILLSAAG